MLELATKQPKPYLIVPSVPTPNGELHLGHIGGPYLRADILARHLRMQGHTVYLACGTDSYDSYVTWQALKEQKPPAAICQHYHKAIARNLASMNIQLDLFVDPLAATHAQRYQSWCEKIFNKLQAKQALKQIKETLLWDDEIQAFCTGCWLLGNCPSCQAEVAGYFCERCGAHFKPEQIKHPRGRAPYQNLVKKSVSNWFMSVPTQLPSANGIIQPVHEVFANFQQAQQSLMRMTIPTYWSPPFTFAAEQSHGFFNYGFVYSYFLLMGEAIAAKFGSTINAFAADSPFITINTFGFDNAVPFLASIYGITNHLTEYKPFDYYLINYFYHLDGSKFSTSRRHAIWVSDVAEKAELASDIVRLYLASIPVHATAGDFDTRQFIDFYNDTATWLQTKLRHTLDKLAGQTISRHDECLTAQWVSLLKQQATYLTPQSYEPDRAVNVIEQWLVRYDSRLNEESSYTWLKGMALLLYPFMPELAGSLWRALTGLDIPQLADFAVTADSIRPLAATAYPNVLTPNQLATLSAERCSLEI
ncbi:MAG: methionine--tRNA ligase [Gammaproteobacteria bacterium]|jgi:methionyl-tRNA synthetase|nr:methionine--tRNA ligase [Gammaproteobacteria bacterium]